MTADRAWSIAETLFPTEDIDDGLIFVLFSKDACKRQNNGKDPSFRPVCLIDTMGKLLEQPITKQLKEEIDRFGGLSERQYGFRQSRSTIDAIQTVINIAKEVRAGNRGNRKLCALLTLNIKNAFNAVKWKTILEE
ncbi:PREDICTED: uncharacterized protein LOC108561222, partial [Nicrophorus vespilloides]|uniref:Uncharacterized protein LOC108561222 n=1 Tax=Nicrophorus vespilloides TaxID=110193 RepID=A0ABM1MJ06_NICVS